MKGCYVMNNTSDWKNEVMDDCIHLHACRRIQKIGRSFGINCPKYCSADCNCYQSKNDNTMLVSVKDAINYARDGVSSIQAGYDSYDVYCSVDLSNRSLTLGELLEKMK